MPPGSSRTSHPTTRQGQSVNNDMSEVFQPGRRFCWAGGDTEGNKPKWWGGSPFRLEIAHIASGEGSAKRVDDRRAVVILSTWAHRVHVADTRLRTAMRFHGAKEDTPTLDSRHTLWLKQKLDPEYYDREFLQSIWIGKLPDPEPLPLWWQQRMLLNQDIALS